MQAAFRELVADSQMFDVNLAAVSATIDSHRARTESFLRREKTNVGILPQSQRVVGGELETRTPRIATVAGSRAIPQHRGVEEEATTRPSSAEAKESGSPRSGRGPAESNGSREGGRQQAPLSRADIGGDGGGGGAFSWRVVTTALHGGDFARGGGGRERQQTTGAGAGADTEPLGGSGRDSAGPMPVVPRVPLERPSFVPDAAAERGAEATAGGRCVADEGLGRDAELASGEPSVPMLEAIADLGRGRVEDDVGVLAEDVDDSIGEGLKKLACEVVESVLEAAVERRVSTTAVEEATAVRDERPPGGGDMSGEGSKVGMLPPPGAGGGVDATYPAGAAPFAPLELQIAVADAVKNSAKAAATGRAAVGRGVETDSAEAPVQVPQLQTPPDVGEIGVGDFGLEARAAGESIVGKSLRMAGGKVEQPSGPVGGVETAPKPADAAEGVESQTAPEAVKEKRKDGVAAKPSGFAIKRQVT